MQAPDLFHVRLETSAGETLIEVHRDWAPIGVDHFYNLVRAVGPDRYGHSWRESRGRARSNKKIARRASR